MYRDKKRYLAPVLPKIYQFDRSDTGTRSRGANVVVGSGVIAIYVLASNARKQSALNLLVNCRIAARFLPLPFHLLYYYQVTCIRPPNQLHHV